MSSALIIRLLYLFLKNQLDQINIGIYFSHERVIKVKSHVLLFDNVQAGVTQLVESQPSKLLVASSSLVSRFFIV